MKQRKRERVKEKDLNKKIAKHYFNNTDIKVVLNVLYKVVFIYKF